MLYLETNFFSDAGYLRLQGRPVLLNFGPQHFMMSSNWRIFFSRAGGDKSAGILHRGQTACRSAPAHSAGRPCG